MQITTLPLGPLQTNCYLLQEGNSAVVIDPGGTPTPIVAHLLKEKIELTHILLTHLHFVHIYGVRALQSITDAPVYASLHDRQLLQTPYGKGGMWGMEEVEPFDFTPLREGHTMKMLQTNCQILSTPGHTPGGVSFYFPSVEAVFTGDALFHRSIGRTDFPGSSSSQLLHSIETQLFALPAETQVFPGHGEATTIGSERLHNPMFGGNAI